MSIERLSVACMIASIAVAVYCQERNYRLARCNYKLAVRNQQLAIEQTEWVKQRSGAL
jgi:hypothetical protein